MRVFVCVRPPRGMCGVLLTSDTVAAKDHNKSAINGTAAIAQQLHTATQHEWHHELLGRMWFCESIELYDCVVIEN